VSCNISKEDIVVPEYCPALGMKLVVSDDRVGDCSPSLDRINPELGYIKGNVAVISHRANRIKNNATANELENIAKWLRTQ
jgi:hypothetical protein